jgi:hypothetical protein
MGGTYILRLALAFKPGTSSTVNRLDVTPEELCDRFEVATAIANQIRLRLTHEIQQRLSSAPRVNAEAHEAYLRGQRLGIGSIPIMVTDR